MAWRNSTSGTTVYTKDRLPIPFAGNDAQFAFFLIQYVTYFSNIFYCLIFCSGFIHTSRLSDVAIDVFLFVILQTINYGTQVVGCFNLLFLVEIDVDIHLKSMSSYNF